MINSPAGIKAMLLAADSCPKAVKPFRQMIRHEPKMASLIINFLSFLAREFSALNVIKIQA